MEQTLVSAREYLSLNLNESSTIVSMTRIFFSSDSCSKVCNTSSRTRREGRDPRRKRVAHFRMCLQDSVLLMSKALKYFVSP